MILVAAFDVVGGIARRALGGLDEVDQGRILVGGKDITHVPANKRNMGIVSRLTQCRYRRKTETETRTPLSPLREHPPGAALAQGAPRSVGDCERIKGDLAYNQCLSLFGPAAHVRDGIAKWRAAGVRTPIIVPSSAAGNQLKAIEEMFSAFSS